MKLFSSLFGLLIMLLAVCFALANRQSAALSLWPFGIEIEAPVYVMTLGTLFFGMVVGAAVTWIGVLPHRLAAKRMQKDMLSLHDKFEHLRQSIMPSKEPPPLLPPRSPRRFWGFRR